MFQFREIRVIMRIFNCEKFPVRILLITEIFTLIYLEYYIVNIFNILFDVKNKKSCKETVDGGFL